MLTGFLFSFLHFRIKGVAQAVSHQIKAENGQHDRKSRKKQCPWSLRQVRPGIRKHFSLLGVRRLRPQP